MLSIKLRFLSYHGCQSSKRVSEEHTLVTIMRLPLLLILVSVVEAISVAQRRKIVQSFNVRRHKSSDLTPLQVGNGNFAFGADITGLQTFKPFAIMSTWGWHNFSLPTTPGQMSVEGKGSRLLRLNSCSCLVRL